MLAKYACMHFRQHKDEHSHKNALVQTSSTVAEMTAPILATYGATKLFNKVFASLLATQLRQSHTTKGLVDGIVLQPSLVTSGMNNHVVAPGISCTPEECARGTLSDLGEMKNTFGSLLHNF